MALHPDPVGVALNPALSGRCDICIASGILGPEAPAGRHV